MKSWEDIVREKMQQTEETLAESVFAEFRARRDAAAAPTSRRFRPAWAAAVAVAASLAAVLLLRKPAAPEGDIRIVPQPSAPVAAVTDSISVSDAGQAAPSVARALTPKPVQPSASKSQEAVDGDSAEPARGSFLGNTEPAEDITIGNAEDAVSYENNETDANEINASAKPVKIKVGPAAGIVAGGGLLAALTTPLLSAFPAVMDGELGGEMAEPRPQQDKISGVSHGFPLRIGLSARIPLAQRWSVTTGLDYSRYLSRFSYTLSGEKVQMAHYLGIPVRLDWSLASGRWLDVYLGGGLEADYCLGATLAGERIDKDGFGFSLLGAGGIQLNLTKQIGLYLEPQVSWTIPSQGQLLQTYRSDNPLMFSLAGGLRINIGN